MKKLEAYREVIVPRDTHRCCRTGEAHWLIDGVEVTWAEWFAEMTFQKLFEGLELQ